MEDSIANILAENLEAMEGGQLTLQECLESYPEHRAELEPLLALAVAMRGMPSVPASAGFRQATRARLIRRIQVRQPAGFRERIWRFLGFPGQADGMGRVRWALVALLVIAMLTGGTLLASASALPGDALYPVKVIVEEVRLVLSGGGADASQHLNLAEQRLHEIDALLEKGSFEYIPTAMARFSEHLEEASEGLSAQTPEEAAKAEAKLQQLNEELANHIEVLSALLETVPEPARAAILLAIQSSSKGQDKLKEKFPDGQPGKAPQDVPVGPPIDAGEPDKTPKGPPDEAGKPDQTPKGPPDDPGKPDSSPKGPPEGVGPPDENGPPQDTGPENKPHPEPPGQQGQPPGQSKTPGPPDSPPGKP